MMIKMIQFVSKNLIIIIISIKGGNKLLRRLPFCNFLVCVASRAACRYV